MMEARLRDGSTVSGQPDAVRRAVSIDREMADQERRWIAHLRAQGVKAAHPDDGWVDRERDTVHLAYPYFNDGCGVGDLLALGQPWGARLVRVTGTSDNPFAMPGDNPWRLHFDHTDDHTDTPRGK